MLKNEDSRASMRTTDLLLASLLELQHAYENMMLPDFFFRTCNLLYKYKAIPGLHPYEASQIGAKIAEILNDPCSVLEELGKKQEAFEEQEKRVGKTLKEVIPNININLRSLQLRLQLSSASLTRMVVWENAT